MTTITNKTNGPILVDGHRIEPGESWSLDGFGRHVVQSQYGDEPNVITVPSTSERGRPYALHGLRSPRAKKKARLGARRLRRIREQEARRTRA